MNKKSFTLIELIISIVVISILVAIIIVQVQNFKERSIATYLQANTKEFQTAMDRYFLDNEKYPILNDSTITVEKPQYIDIAKLVKEGYLKKDLDLNKISTQHYQVDVFGRVWGSSQPSLENAVLVSSENDSKTLFSVDVSSDVKKVVLYEVTNGKLVTAGEYQLNSYFAGEKSVNSKVKFNEVDEISISGNTKLQINIEDTNKIYLVSGVDKYDLESAPVGLGYNSEIFGPILQGDGTFEYILEGPKFKKWIEFITVQKTPSGSSINYSFAVKEKKNGEYSEFITDFHSLPDAYGIKVKVQMNRGENGARPSLESLRVIYSEGEEEVEVMKPHSSSSQNNNEEAGSEEEIYVSGNSITKIESTCPNPPAKNKDGFTVLTYTYGLEEGKSVLNLSGIEAGYSKVDILYEKDGHFYEVSSYLDIPEGSCFYVYVFYPLTQSEGTTTSIKKPQPPVVKVASNDNVSGWKVITHTIKEKSQGSNNSGDNNGGENVSNGYPTTQNLKDKELKDEDWVTISDIRFFQHGSGDKTIWKGYTSEEEVIENKTRILYRFALGNGYYWSEELTEFPTDSTSNALLVHVYFQIHKDYIADKTLADPILKSLIIHGSNKDYPVGLDKPQMLIYPEKNNNNGNPNVSNESIIDWKYQALDPNGLDIVNVEWDTLNINKVKYLVGQYSIKGRVQNSTGVWSDWITYTFNVLEEKPVAKFNLSSGKDYILVGETVKFNTSESFDPDGDKIVDYEWKNKKSTYSASDVGMITVSLRVKDGEGHWSEWVEKQFRVSTSESDWFIDGVASKKSKYYASFDGDELTYSNLSGKTVTWEGNLEGKTIRIKSSSKYGQGYYLKGYLNFIDENGSPVYALSNKNSYAQKHLIEGGNQEIRLIVPVGAKGIVFDDNMTSVHELSLVKSIDSPTIINLKPTPNVYVMDLSIEKSVNATTTYVISGNVLKGFGNGDKLSFNLLQPNTTYNWRVLTVNADFIASEEVSFSFKTKEGDVTFYGLGLGAFDKNASTAVNTTGATITWDQDISGETLYVQIGTNSVYGDYKNANINFRDANGNKMYTLNNQDKYALDAYLAGANVNVRIIVPEGAKSLRLEGEMAKVYSIHLVTGGKRIEGVSNISSNAGVYSVTNTWSKPANVTKTYVINGTTLRNIETGTSATTNLIAPNTNYAFKVISVDASFNSSSMQIVSFKTKEADVIFYGLSIGAFDKNSSTSVNTTGATITWDRDITGKKLYVTLTSGNVYGNYKDAILNFRNASGAKIGSDIKLNGSMVSTTIVVPAGATSLKLEGSLSSVTNIHITN